LSTIVLVFENKASTDLAMGRSSVRRRILTVLADPQTRLHLREIQRRAGTSPGTASRELARLLAAGLVEREAEGNQVYFRGATTPLATMLRSLLTGSSLNRPETGARPAHTPTTTAPNLTQPARSPRSTAAGRVATSPEPETFHGSAAAAESGKAAGSVVNGPAVQVEPGPDVAGTGVAWTPDPRGLDVASRLADRIRPAYGERLVGVYLYGARARGEPKPDSNVDVLLVLDQVDRYGDELELTSSACADLSQEEGLVVSRVFVSEAAWRTRSDGQMPAIRKEAVAV
jgi:uncharacterized protein